MIESQPSWQQPIAQNRPSSMLGTNTEVNYGDLKNAKLANDQSIDSIGCATVNLDRQKAMLSQSNTDSIGESINPILLNGGLSPSNLPPVQRYFGGPTGFKGNNIDFEGTYKNNHENSSYMNPYQPSDILAYQHNDSRVTSQMYSPSQVHINKPHYYRPSMDSNMSKSQSK